MKLLKTKCKIRCETGGCRNFADYVLYMDRCGVHTSVYLCGQCLSQLKELLSDGCTDEQTASDVLLRGEAVGAEKAPYANGTGGTNDNKAACTEKESRGSFSEEKPPKVRLAAKASARATKEA